jgi:hypothetical protein
MSTKTEKPLCPVCIEPYTSSVRKECKCPYCSQSCCVKCIQHYFLNSIEDAHCMHCKNKFSKEILYGFCTKTFVNTTYFHHRQTILLNRSKSFLPDAQIKAEIEIEIEKLDDLIEINRETSGILQNEKNMEIYEVQREISRLKIDMIKNKNNGTDHTAQIKELEASIKEKEESYRAKNKELVDEFDELFRRKLDLRYDLTHDHGNDNDDPNDPELNDALQNSQVTHEKKKFVRRCTNDGCRGFLSTQWKCGLCEHWVCPDCFEVKGTEKNTEHTCKPENIESANLIKKDTKPCPSCGEMIMKIDGCDMMWCTSCHTPFSWNNSTVIQTGYIHNPHYFQWIRESGREVPRNPNDVPHNDCNNITPYRRYNRLCNRSFKSIEDYKGEMDKLQKLHQLFADMRYNQIEKYNEMIENDENEERMKYAVNYIRGRITEEQWKLSLGKYEKKIEKIREIKGILDALYAAYNDILHQVDLEIMYPEEEALALIHKIFDELEQLRETMMPYLRTVSKNYNCVVPYINESWNVCNINMNK